ncbi:MAG TPA: TetR family transcriptional regulator [Gaiellaceae bacterium]|nr:TetR family transcriptional regulator [Gaiellaceae bacterium]
MSSSPDEQARPGLRERKKAKTRASVQRQALRLFREHGYDATTVEQIADAAEISPSTFFRYFPSKEDVVLHDRYDPLLIAAFHAQPAELTPITALRRAIREVFAALPREEVEQERQRARLILSVPELRARSLDQLAEGTRMIAAALAERTGRDPHDTAVIALAGALVGVGIAAIVAASHDPEADYLALVDAAMAHLESGLTL